MRTICSLIICLVLLAGFAAASIVDKVAVVVNDEVITSSEIDELVAPIYEKYKTIYKDEELAKKVDEARQKIVDRLIDEKLLYAAAKKEKIELDEREIDERLDEVKKNFSSKEDFEQALMAENIGLSKLRERYREQLTVRSFVEKKVISKISVSPTEVDDYYKSHPEAFNEPEKVKLSNILIRLRDTTEAAKEAGALAKDIVKKLKEGEGFASLAERYSEGPGADAGGSMGYAKRGDLMKEIEDVVFAMKTGEISDVVQTGLGYHIFMVEERTEARSKGLLEVRKEIEEVLFREKIDKGVKELVKDLRKNAYIAFK